MRLDRAVLVLLGVCLLAAAKPDSTSLVVTAGSVREVRPGAFEIRSPGVRANFGTRPGSDAEIEFVYRGPSQREERLASGELRRQIGLKLRGRDTCNVVYVMWHIEPRPRIEVSFKANAGQSTHAECGDRGYRFLTPTSTGGESRPIEVGSQHRLRATISSGELSVTTDGQLSWKGRLPQDAFAFDGPAGVRSDNGDFDFTFRVF